MKYASKLTIKYAFYKLLEFLFFLLFFNTFLSFAIAIKPIP